MADPEETEEEMNVQEEKDVRAVTGEENNKTEGERNHVKQEWRQ